MKFLPILYCVFLSGSLFSQGHDAWIKKINSVADAHKYASKHKDVIVDLVNPELDVFLFDEVDLSHLSQYVGQTRTLYNRKTKFLKDTIVYMTDLHSISITAKNKFSADSMMALLQNQLDSGTSFWDLMRKYQNKSDEIYFRSGPIRADQAELRYGISLIQAENGQVFKINNDRHTGFLIVDQQIHPVPAFIAISYNSNLNE